MYILSSPGLFASLSNRQSGRPGSSKSKFKHLYAVFLTNDCLSRGPDFALSNCISIPDSKQALLAPSPKGIEATMTGKH